MGGSSLFTESTDELSLTQAQLTIYCGDDDFTPDPARGIHAWVDMTSFLDLDGVADHGGNPNARLCGQDIMAQTLNSLNHGKAYQIVVLCDPVLLRGRAPHSVATVADLAAVTGSAGLYRGKPIDDVAYATVVSFTLAHEMFHVVLTNQGSL